MQMVISYQENIEIEDFKNTEVDDLPVYDDR